MTHKTSHIGNPSTSFRHKLAIDIFKDARGPMTVMEIQDESRARGSYLANPGTTLWEITQHPGYKASSAQEYGQQKEGPAVRFPDGKYRYWLEEAPGWRQSWMVTQDFKVVPTGSQNRFRDSHKIIIPAKTAQVLVTAEAAQLGQIEMRNAECGMRNEPEPDPGPRLCVKCRSPIGRGAMCDACKKEMFGDLPAKGGAPP